MRDKWKECETLTNHQVKLVISMQLVRKYYMFFYVVSLEVLTVSNRGVEDGWMCSSYDK